MLVVIELALKRVVSLILVYRLCSYTFKFRNLIISVSLEFTLTQHKHYEKWVWGGGKGASVSLPPLFPMFSFVSVAYVPLWRKNCRGL